MTNWKEIHEEFTEELQKEWKGRRFLKDKEVRAWINVGLKPSEAGYAYWLEEDKFRGNKRNNQKSIVKYQEWIVKHFSDQELRKEYEEYRKWVSVHKGFSESPIWFHSWKDSLFTPQEAKLWIAASLEVQDNNLAAYARGKGYQLQQINKEELEKEQKEWEKKPKSAQEYLDIMYPEQKKEEVKMLNISDKNLAEELDLRRFKNVEKLWLFNNHLVNLNLSQNSQLRRFNCSENQLTNCDFLTSLPKAENLTRLDLRNNDISQDLSVFSRFRNLEILWVDNNLFFGSLNPLKNLINLEELSIRNTQISGSLEYLVNLEKLQSLDISDTDIDSGVEYLPPNLSGVDWNGRKNIFYSTSQKPDSKVKKIKEKLEIFINDESNKKKVQGWKKLDFSSEETTQWMSIGLNTDDYLFANYLKKQKNLTPEEAKNNLSKLRKDYEISLSSQWSETRINKFIQETGLKKIPHDQLSNVEYLTKGGFGKIYQAEWEDKNIILKSLNNSQELTVDFLKEIANHKLFDNDKKETRIVKCYGISQDSEGNYIMVMDYIRGGNLREYSQRNASKLDLKKKLIQLHSIAEGLNSIHKKGLVHKDFHLGNILSAGTDNFFTDLKCYITDLGLCKPLSEENKEGEVYGVMPYMAPEVLRGGEYAQPSDIYSFGMVVYAVLSNYPPFYDREYEINLVVDICKGERPQFKIKIPQLLEILINDCWNDDISKRPSARELSNILENWINEINENKNAEFSRQVREAEEYNKSLSPEISCPNYKLNPKATQCSKLINTKQISELLRSQVITSISVDTSHYWQQQNSESQEEFRIKDDEIKLKEVSLEEQVEDLKKQLTETQQQVGYWREKCNQVKQERDEFQTKIQQLENWVKELEKQVQVEIAPK